MARSLSSVLSPSNMMIAPALAGRVEVANEVIYVRGTLDSYEVHLPGGAIFRQSDGRRVRITELTPQQVSFPLPGVGGVMEIMRHVLILAEDQKNTSILQILAA